MPVYLITSCASCAAPLEPTGTGVKQCSRCKTRYCSASCQRDHWKKRGGHGIEHPTTQNIAASLSLCFDEQLGWSVDDTPAELLAVRPLLDDFPADLAGRLGSIVDSDDEGDTPEIALVYQARREREEKESREQSAKWAADYSRGEWKGRTRRKKVESPDAIVVP